MTDLRLSSGTGAKKDDVGDKAPDAGFAGSTGTQR